MFTVTDLVKLYRYKSLRKIARKLVSLRGCEIPVSVKIESDVQFPHNSVGTVIHNNTEIRSGVKIYQNVTIGRANIWEKTAEDFEGFLIDEGAILCAGCKVLCSHGKLRVGKNAVIGANTVVTESIPDNAIVAGVPAKILRYRDN